ncbi:MAG: DMT family transporter [Bacillota bacterium]|nr:DMT family transporter [Bacillota bacterium]
MQQKLKGEILLLLAALIWGSAFIFQKMGMDYIGPFTFGFFRFTLGALALIPVILIFDRLRERTREKSGSDETAKYSFKNKELLIGGLLTGLACFVASSFQQVGIVYTTAGKAGFISSLYIVLVPICLIFFRKKVSFITWIAIAVGAFGLYLLCITENFTISLGDGLVVCCALFYALQIIFIDIYVDRTDPAKLAFLEFMVTGILSGVAMLLFETVELQAVLDCVVPILYTAVFEVSIAFTLGIFGQQYTPPTIAAILMSLESVFAVLCGMLFLGEVMSGREIMGCVVMFAAVLISQLHTEAKADSKRE